MFVSWWNGETRIATVAISKKPILEAASMTTLIYSYYIANCNKSYFRGIIESLIDVRPHVMVVVVRSSLAITKRCWQAFHDFLIFSSCFSLSICETEITFFIPKLLAKPTGAEYPNVSGNGYSEMNHRIYYYRSLENDL